MAARDEDGSEDEDQCDDDVADVERPLVPKADKVVDVEHSEHCLTDPLVWNFIIFLVLVAVGVAGAMYIEGLSFVTALYVITQIVTTIGHGDFTVHTDLMKFFCSFYVLALLVFAAYAVNPIIEAIQQKQGTILASTMTWDESTTRYKKLFTASLMVFCFIAFGTIFYATYEGCSCS